MQDFSNGAAYVEFIYCHVIFHETLEDAIAFTGVRNPKVVQRPKLLSDNGPCYVSKALKEYLDLEGIFIF